MRVEKKVDWLQFSIPKLPDLNWTTEILSSPSRFYKTMVVNEHGAQAHLGNPNSNKYLIIMSGSVMEHFATVAEQRDFIENMLSQGAKVSRIDWAITQEIDHDGLITRQDVGDLYDAGNLKGAWTNYTPKGILNWENKNVETLNFGDIKNRSKKGMFRVYDKGVDLNIEEYLITRLEAEERKDNAHKSAYRFAQGNDIGSIVRSRIDSTDAQWQAVMDAPEMDITRGSAKETTEEEKMRSRWAWLMEQVAPAVAQAMVDDIENNKDHANFIAFQQRIKTLYQAKMLKR